MDDRARWPDVARDVLRDIAGRLHDAADFVRFHSVCKPWRDSHDVPLPSLSTTKTSQFLPWLLASADKDPLIKLRCIFSKSSYRVPWPPRHHQPPRRNWISCADGTAVRYMTVDHLRRSLHDPINGEKVEHLPRFRWDYDEGDPHGIVYGDGTVLLYNNDGMAKFSAALLRPGNAEWKLFNRTFENPTSTGRVVAYHRGKILVPMLPRLPPKRKHLKSYVLESRGELLCVSIHTSMDIVSSCDAAGLCLSVSMHVLLDQEEEQRIMRWVKKDGHSLADRALFLGTPNSFAIDASKVGGHGGLAFFTYYSNDNNNSKALLPGGEQSFGVFKYNLIDNKIEFVERLPPGWSNDKCTWLIPRPAIAPVQEITTRSALTNNNELEQKQSVGRTAARISHMVRHYEPSMTVLVRNLPLAVKTSDLQNFFGNHGKVSHAKIIYCQNTKTSHAIITITTVHAYHEEAVDILNGLVMNNCRLQVSLVKQENRRRRHGRVPLE